MTQQDNVALRRESVSRQMLFDFINYLTGRWQADHPLVKLEPARFSTEKRGATHHYNRPTNTHYITYGVSSMVWWAENGWSEGYKTLLWIQGGRRPTGLEAMWWLWAHETAHIHDTINGGRKYGVAHGPSYVREYERLRAVYPFADLCADFLAAQEAQAEKRARLEAVRRESAARARETHGARWTPRPLRSF